MSSSAIMWFYSVCIILIVLASAYRHIRRYLYGHDKAQHRADYETNMHVKFWAERHGLRYYNIGNQLRQAARMEANRGKDYFRADEAMGMEDDGPYAEGSIDGRNVWLYVSVGLPRVGSLHTITREREIERPIRGNVSVFSYLANGSGTQSVRQAQQVLYAWCLEISAHRIPHRLRITRQGLQEVDELDTESRAFEDRYDVNHFEDSLALQLLDPHMMQLIIDSRADAIEFSDSSVVLYELSKNTTAEVLDALLTAGLKIAKQVDQNYPLGKYTKQA